MRRLPIYFLIDVSESMVGEPIQAVEDGLAMIIKELKTDPYAIETVWVSIIVFAGQPKTLVPLQEIINFYPPRFPIGSGTSLSQGLGHLMFELRRNIVKTTYEQKGDWKPLVFLFTDGVPTDETKVAVQEWKNNWARTANMVAVSFGRDSNIPVLHDLTENVIAFKQSDQGSYKRFFKWVTDSIKTNSESVESGNSSFEMAKLDETVVQKVEKNEHQPRYNVDDNYVVLAGKCQNTKRPYLMKYGKASIPSNIPGLEEMGTRIYKLIGAYPVDNTYHELTDGTAKQFSINTNELWGAPTCPCCGNQFGFAMCGCGEIHCVGIDEIDKGDGKPPKKQSCCPGCNTMGSFGAGGSEGFDVNRTQG